MPEAESEPLELVRLLIDLFERALVVLDRLDVFLYRGVSSSVVSPSLSRVVVRDMDKGLPAAPETEASATAPNDMLPFDILLTLPEDDALGSPLA